jgi:hypothetical protein
MGLAKNNLGLGRKKTAGRRGRRPGRPAKVGRPRGRPPGRAGLTHDIVRGIARMQDDAQSMRGALREIAKLAGRF